MSIKAFNWTRSSLGKCGVNDRIGCGVIIYLTVQFSNDCNELSVA